MDNVRIKIAQLELLARLGNGLKFISKRDKPLCNAAYTLEQRGMVQTKPSRYKVNLRLTSHGERAYADILNAWDELR